MNRSTLVFALLLLTSAQIAWAQIPQVMSYQGVLRDASGDLVVNGNYSLTFKLYDGVSTELWSETQPAVAVSSGVFSVILGSINPLALPFDEAYFLGITIGTGPELSPRTPLSSSPYSLRSQIADALSGSGISALLPVGTVISSLLNPTALAQEAGSNWVLADGRNVTGSRYANLTGQNNVPDMRGLFLRGLNEGRADGLQDPDGAGRIVGDIQTDELASHNHPLVNANDTCGSGGLFVYQFNAGFTEGNTTGNTGGAETRPNNAAVYHYVKVD